MKRTIWAIALALAVLAASAKTPIPCPANYYDAAKGKSSQALLTALYSIVGPHTNIGYDGLFDAYKDTDCDQGGYIIDMYSNYDRFTCPGSKCGNYSKIGDCFNREHSVPKSWWGGGKQAQYSDLINIVPTDGYVNNQRSNYPYGECQGGTRLKNGQYVAKGRLGSSTHSGYSGTVFEPDDEYKGDFARAYFYMAACYNNTIGNWTSSGGSAFFNGTQYPVFTNYAIGLLMEWTRLDPVSQKEKTRNNYVHAWQGNRNPFIDHPELAEYLWGNKKGQAWYGDDIEENTPCIIQPVSGGTIDVGTIAADGTSVSKAVTVSGQYLTQAVSITVSGEGFSVTPATLSASAVCGGNATVAITYSGKSANASGTLTIGSAEVNATCSLTASKIDGGGPGPGPDPADDSWIETWEGVPSGGYYTSNVQGATFLWSFNNAGIFAQSNDHWNDTIGCRFGKNSNSSIKMLEDVQGTSGISFYACTYGSDSQATLKVLYSTDGGNNWTTLMEQALSREFTNYTHGLDVAGNVRFMFQQTAGSRLNLDDIAIYKAAPAPEPEVYFDGAVEDMAAVLDGESSISEITVASENNTQAITVTASDNFEISLNQRDWATTLTLDASGETFYVRMASTAAVGTYEGTVTARAGAAVAFANVYGEVSAPAFVIGDVNDDGNVDPSDISALIDYLLNGTATAFNALSADVNQDGNIDPSDISAIIDLLLNGPAAIKWYALPADGGISMVNPLGETLEVYDLDANLVAAVASQTTISLPAGAYIVTSDIRSRKVVVK